MEEWVASDLAFQLLFKQTSKKKARTANKLTKCLCNCRVKRKV